MNNEVAIKGTSAGVPPALQVPAAAFIKEFAPLPAMRRCCGIDTPIKASRAEELPTLVSIRKAYGEAFILGFIKLWIIDLIEYLGGKEMTDAQLEETSMRVYHNNYYLNIADLNLVLNRVKDGDITVAAPINGAKLNQLFAAYRDERMNAVAVGRANEHEVLKKHGYIPKVDHIAEAMHETMVENQMAAAERQAKAELAELDYQYRQLCRFKAVWEKYPQLKGKPQSADSPGQQK
jgi:hypothetical protein